MDKSTHLITLENLRFALSNFDMSFGVSNKLFRLAIVSEILDTACLFEQLFDAWSQRLPYGEGPDADVDFAYWKNLNTWGELLDNAQQNLCIDNYSLDLGNGQNSDDIRGNRRKNYTKNLKAALKSAKYADFQNVTDFAKLISNDKSGMMTFGNMVFNAIHSLHTILGQIEDLLKNPPQELFQNYYEQQRERFSDEIANAKQKTKEIMHESIVEKRKINRLKEMRDSIVDALRESGFLTDLMTAYTHYDIEDYRNDNDCPELSDEIVLERLVLEDLLTDDMQLDRKKIAKHIYEHRKTLSRETIATFYLYAEVSPEIERLLDILKDYDAKHGMHLDANKTHQVMNISLTPVRQSIFEKLLILVDKGDWRHEELANSVKEMLRTVLGQGETLLLGNEAEQSETLWHLLENGRGDRVIIVWQNLVGYLDDKKLFRQKGSPALNKDFFGDDKGYTNIDKGRPSKGLMTPDFESIIPLLDAYVPIVG